MKTQKLINVLFTVVFTCIEIAAVAQPSWTVNPGLYDYSMTVTGKIFVNGDFSADPSDVIAAFIDGECRGVAKVKHQSVLKDYFVFLMIYSNNPTCEISFKIYDASENQEIEVGSIINFSVNGIVGSVSNPYEFGFSMGTGAYDVKILPFRIFPNPVYSSLFIGIPDSDEATVCITNVAGQIVKTGQLSPGIVNEIPMVGFKSGIYIIRIHQGENQMIRKVVKK